LPHVGVIPVSEVHVDVVGAEAAQGVVDGRADVLGGEPGALRGGAHLRSDDEVISLAAAPQPLTDDLLRLPAGVAGVPGGIGIRGIDREPTGGGEPVKKIERGVGIGGPSEYVASEDE